MAERLRLMAVLAHPDDESLGTGGTLAHYAAAVRDTTQVTLAIEPEQFRQLGHRLVDDIADFVATLPHTPFILPVEFLRLREPRRLGVKPPSASR